MDRNLYTAIDANINRALEGVRVCEDILRFCLHRADSSARAKEIRHRIAEAARLFPRGLLLHGRDVDADEQKLVDLGREGRRDDLDDLCSANLHRAMEAVRSLEEFGKLALPGMDGNPFQEIRFMLYALERDVVPVLRREAVMARFSRALYAVLDPSYMSGTGYRDAAQAMIRGGASVIQLRMKGGNRKEVLETAKDLAALCRAGKVVFIVNDHADIAVLAGADGVHLGINDLQAEDARRLLPPEMIIGVSVYTPDGLALAAPQGADYIAVGPVFDTEYKTEKGSIRLRGSGVELVARARKLAGIPIVAIGGITAAGAGKVIAAGADAVAVTSALYENSLIEDNCRALAGAARGE
jgi:thiamine-phosphate pyrophosphorylase